METLDTFQRFIKKFSSFFNPCELGFRNEFVMQMYSREFPPGEEIVTIGKKFREILFITDGKIHLKTKDKNIFMELTDGNIFGDYQVICDLVSNISFNVAHRVSGDEYGQPGEAVNSKFMCCEKGVVEDLIELYPNTGENLRMRALEKRAVFLYYMGEPTSVIKNFMESES